MGLKLYTSNRIEELSTLFCSAIGQKESWHQTSHVIVQTQGLQKWLAKQAVAQNKIFANYEFSSPDAFIAKIQKDAGIYGNTYFSAQNMKWKNYTYLNDEDFINQFAAVASYYHGDDIKRIQLAGKVADVFDQYQVYRPQIIEAWNKKTTWADNTDDDFEQQEQWQRWLWQKLKAESDKRLDGVQRKRALLEKFEDPSFQMLLKNKFPHIHLFGIAVFSNYHWEIYQKLATIIDLSVYITSPSATADWQQPDEASQGNELLASCQDLSANLQQLLASEESDDRYITPQGESLLISLQRDVFNNDNQGIKKDAFPTDDRSLCIASSFTPVREVEALYNHLLNEFEKNPDLKGSEVSVQLSDVDLYAPLVKAVFDNAPKRIPYLISDENFSTGDSLIKALDILFNLPYSNFKAENVLQLLDYKAIRERFEINDVDMVRQIVADANIRYGIEGHYHDDTYLFSWRHGVSKLILGYAMKGSICYTMDDTDFFPCDAIEGSDALNIFKIKAFAETLFDLYAHSQSKKSITEWKEYLLNDVFNALFQLNDSYNEEIDHIYKKLEGLSKSTISIDEKMSFAVFREGLMNLLRSDASKSIYTSGLVTFSSILPVRSIPFKHIAILGLNSGVFPRQQKDLGFDLIAMNPMPNDRNIKNNDKYLFLEALLSARQQLYLSYIGSSIKDNSELPPSLLIEELEEYLITGTGNKEWFEEKIKYKHPLHASSKLYFTQEKLFTYLGETKKEELTDVKENTKKEENILNFEEINLDHLVAFYKDPFKWYYNKILGIYYNDDALLLPDEEPFSLDHLQKWALKKELVTLPHEEEEDFLKRRKNDGGIQLGNMAKAASSIEKTAVQTVKEAYHQEVIGTLSPLDIKLKFGKSILVGQLDNKSENGLVNYNVSGAGSQAKYLLEMFIKHLAYKVSHKNARSVYISSTYAFALESDFIDATAARQLLRELIDLYKIGHIQLLPFTPNAGLSLMNALYHDRKILPKNEAILKAVKHIVERYPSDYISKEIALDYFEGLLNNEVAGSDSEQQKIETKQEQLFQLSEILFRKLSTLLAIQ